MRYLLCLVVWILIAVPLWAQDEEDDNPFRPGLVATYSQDATRLRRHEPALTLVGSDRPLDPRLKPGAVRVAWQGRLLTQGAGEYRLHVYGQGKFTITLADQQVLAGERATLGWLSTEKLNLEHDYHQLDVRYESPADAQHARLFWSGELFSLEPVPAKQLFHEPAQPTQREPSFEQGRALAQALRCDKCHSCPGEPASPVGPALDRIGKLFQPGQLARGLSQKHGQVAKEATKVETSERTPRFAKLDPQAAADIAAYLTTKARDLPAFSQPAAVGDAARGNHHFHTLGCLACHQNQAVGMSGLWSGGDLSHVGSKYESAFFSRWLVAPQTINREHRMPVFELNVGEQTDLAAYLQSLQADKQASHEDLAGDAERGERVVQELNCAACHRLPTRVEPHPLSKWPTAAATAICRDVTKHEAKTAPIYRLSTSDTADLLEFLSVPRGQGDKDMVSAASAQQLLAQRNCLSCHPRETSAGLAPELVNLAKHDAQYQALLPALTPPSLVSVGDKLHDTVLLAMMKKMEQPHRDYLRVRMPRFDFTQEELETLLAHFKATDRIPPEPPDARLTPPVVTAAKDLDKAGETLVTTAGFGCTSCHAIGGKPPVKATLNARGPNLSQIGWRTREPWFYRWCQNPARIIPGQEMPAVQVPVKGVLGDDVRPQLAAVWTVLNKPGFEPKDAGPLRVARRSGNRAAKEAALVGTDVLKIDQQTYLAPVVIGLANRHNLLVDLDSGRLARWWLGDTMEQRTQGKTWYWQTEAPDLLQAGFDTPELTLVRPGNDPVPQRVGQFLTEIDEIQHDGERVTLLHRWHYQDIAPSPGERTIFVRQSFAPLESTAWHLGFERFVGVTGLPKGSVARLRVLSSDRMKSAKLDDKRRAITLPEGTLRLAADASGQFEADGTLTTPASAGEDAECWLRIEYHAVDRPEPVLVGPEPQRKSTRAELTVIPGLSATRLPLDATIMPTAFAWQRQPDGAQEQLVIASLEGRLWLASDDDADGVQERTRPLLTEFAAPYGAAIVPHRRLGTHVDVIAKDALWRVFYNQRGQVERLRRLASGWGHTEDYHDWAVGLVPADAQRYFAAIPAQQDKRSTAAARHRGQTLEITFDDALRSQQPWDVPKFELKPISAGHRFPMGIARSRHGALFVTDNQGNYNPFNELNHVQPGKDFGFVNALEKGLPKPPLTPPAVNIPHPWTRSVNGICFLETPAEVRKTLGRAAWGPFEDHLVGCEYDTRRLIRISLQKIGDTYQGACYPLSLEKPANEGLLGPICCAIAPSGELYVGNIRDSGWGGGNNTGEVVRVDYPRSLQDLPSGIAEVRATSEGFEIEFTQPVDKARAADAANYTLESFTRKSTPAYGGPDEQRRVEKLQAIEVAPDAKRVRIKLAELRPGFVYEWQLKNLTSAGEGLFFPALAYYTLNQIPAPTN